MNYHPDSRFWPQPAANPPSPDAPAQGGRAVSIVVPVLNEAASVGQLLPALADTLHRLGLEFELIVVDDGGNDNLADVVTRFEAAHGPCNVQLLRLSRNFGKEAALTAGIAAARGDAVLCMDGDGQHPVTLVPDMIARWRDGYDMVVATQRDRASEGRAMTLAKRLFYRLLQGGERFVIPADAGDFRLMDRRVVQALLALPERTRFMKGLYAWVGFKTALVPFDAAPRIAGTSKFRLLQLADLASLAMTSFSLRPLRLVSAIGAVISVCALGYGVYIMAETLFIGNRVSGWATLASGMMLLSGIQLLCLGVMAEYLGRIFEETKQRPLYLIADALDHSRLGKAGTVLRPVP